MIFHLYQVFTSIMRTDESVSHSVTLSVDQGYMYTLLFKAWKVLSYGNIRYWFDSGLQLTWSPYVITNGEFRETFGSINYDKSGERSTGLIPVIPQTTIINVLNFFIVSSILVDQQVISVQDRSHYLCWTEKVHNVLYYLGSWNWEQGSCKASASYMLR